MRITRPRTLATSVAAAGSLTGMFDFGAKHGHVGPNAAPFTLDPQTGQPVG